MTKRTFTDYAAMDPRIGELLKQVQAVKAVPGKPFCANRVWYGAGGLRSKVIDLAGHARTIGPSELQTSQAYDVVYHKAYRALPDCDNCGCFC
jgi:hypothetical protein